MPGDQLTSSVVIACSDRVVHRFGHLPSGEVPGRGSTMQSGNERRIATLELGPQAGMQQVVIAVPIATVVELDKEQVRPREALQHRAGVLRAHDGIAQWSRHPFKDRAANHELADRRLLSEQYLFHQVVDDVPLGAGKAGDEFAAIDAVA